MVFSVEEGPDLDDCVFNAGAPNNQGCPVPNNEPQMEPIDGYEQCKTEFLKKVIPLPVYPVWRIRGK